VEGRGFRGRNLERSEQGQKTTLCKKERRSEDKGRSRLHLGKRAKGGVRIPGGRNPRYRNGGRRKESKDPDHIGRGTSKEKKGEGGIVEWGDLGEGFALHLDIFWMEYEERGEWCEVKKGKTINNCLIRKGKRGQ